MLWKMKFRRKTHGNMVLRGSVHRRRLCKSKKRCDIESDDLKLVARALLPPEIMEGSRLKYELIQYEII